MSNEIKKYFTECAGLQEEDIINHMLPKGKFWAEEKIAEDDITFVVMKMK